MKMHSCSEAASDPAAHARVRGSRPESPKRRVAAPRLGATRSTLHTNARAQAPTRTPSSARHDRRAEPAGPIPLQTHRTGGATGERRGTTSIPSIRPLRRDPAPSSWPARAVAASRRGRTCSLADRGGHPLRSRACPRASSPFHRPPCPVLLPLSSNSAASATSPAVRQRLGALDGSHFPARPPNQHAPNPRTE